jgi:N-acetylneuraminic acid mutarotase
MRPHLAVLENLALMVQRTVLVASAAALACGGASAPAHDGADPSNHAAAPGSPEAAAPGGDEAGPTTDSDDGVPRRPPIGGATTVDEPPVIDEPIVADIAPASCVGEPGCPWSVRESMPDARRGQGTVALDGLIYVIGGESARDARRTAPVPRPSPTPESTALYSSVFAYDPSSDSWSDRAPMPNGLYVLTAHPLNGKIYAFGGYGQQGFDASVQVYDPASNTWQLEAPMPTPRYVFTSEVVDGKVYVIGGQGPLPEDPTGDWHVMSHVDIFDPALGWSSGAPSPEPLAEAASCAIDGRVFVFGGMVGNRTSIYDVATDQWTLGSPPLVARAGHVCVRAGSNFYLLGGSTGDVMADSVEKYDPTADTWQTLPSLPTARLRLGATAIGDEIFAFGGENIVTTTYGNFGLSAAVEVLRVAEP